MLILYGRTRGQRAGKQGERMEPETIGTAGFILNRTREDIASWIAFIDITYRFWQCFLR